MRLLGDNHLLHVCGLSSSLYFLDTLFFLLPVLLHLRWLRTVTKNSWPVKSQNLNHVGRILHIWEDRCLGSFHHHGRCTWSLHHDTIGVHCLSFLCFCCCVVLCCCFMFSGNRRNESRKLVEGCVGLRHHLTHPCMQRKTTHLLLYSTKFD